MMRERGRLFAFFLGCMLCGWASTASASFHFIEISEVFTGLYGDTSVQFIELRTFSAGQNLLSGHTIVARNADGSVANTVFTFPGNFGAGASNEYILIATPNFAALAGITPDFTFSGGLFPGAGQIDLFPPGIDTDGLSYGAYTGPGTPLSVGLAPAIPGSSDQSLQLTSGLGTGYSGNDGVNYALATNNPRNNAGQVGFVTIPTVASPLIWPSGLEDFESAFLGASVNQAITGWTIVGGSPGLYEAVISDSLPAGGPGGGSTQWLAITDTDTTSTGNINRVYSNSIVTNDSVLDYTFEFQIYITDLGSTSDTLIVAQHRTNTGYFNVAGLRLAQTGVEGITVGAANGGIAHAGPSVIQPLYAYTDSGGFAQASWVRVGFSLDFVNGELTAFATGTDQVTQKSTTIGGLSFSDPTALPGDFRLCIRNNGLNNTSTVSYDNIQFNATVVGLNSAAAHWTLY